MTIPIIYDIKERPIKLTFDVILLLIVAGIITVFVIIAFLSPSIQKADFIRGFISKLFSSVS